MGAVRSSRKLVVQREHPRLAFTLFSDFNHWRSYCADVRRRRQTQRVADYVLSDERLDLFEEMDAWCREREIESRLWLYLLFRARRWNWSPPLERAHLCSERMVPGYRKARCLDGYRRHLFGAQPRERYFDPNLEISPTNEARKADLLQQPGGPHRCMALMVDTTYGYHPRSEVCRRCPLGPECAQQLSRWCDFDVMALRLGDLSKVEAIRSAIAAGEG